MSTEVKTPRWRRPTPSMQFQRREAADLHGQPRHHARRSAGAGRDAAVFQGDSSATRPAATTRLAGPRKKAVETARERIAKLIGATTKEIIFTSGATESDNLAIKGVAEMYREKGNHIITAVTEHKAVLDTCKRLEKYGYRVTYLPVQKDGLIDLDDLKRAMDDKTILVTIMAANNEIGVLQPWAEIGKLCHERGVLFHTDATQAVGKVPIDVNKDNIDLHVHLGHKMYGPKGVGALYVRRKNPRVQISAIIDGGGHERGMRSGTLNVPGIVGLGKACAICHEEMPQESKPSHHGAA